MSSTARAVVDQALAGRRQAALLSEPSVARMAELLAVRKHAGMIVPAPVQAAMVAALGDETHVGEQRALYSARREALRDALVKAGFSIEHSTAGLYLWSTRGEDCWATGRPQRWQVSRPTRAQSTRR